MVIGSGTAVTNWRWLVKPLPRVFGEGQLVQVFDADDLREVYRVRVPSRSQPGWLISEDGSVFVTHFVDADTRTSSIDVWDMNPRRAQVYGGLSGVAAVLTAIAFGKWRRRRKVAAKG